jgi:hypothetical protein
MEKIFSGENSKDMWNAIKAAKTVKQLRDVLYLVCCQLQELESRMPESKDVCLGCGIKFVDPKGSYCSRCGKRRI